MLRTYPTCVARFQNTTKLDTKAYTMFGHPHLVLEGYAIT